jgi:hypothetical protein
MRRWAIFGLLSTTLLAADNTATTLRRYCVGCHNSALKSANLIINPAASANPQTNPETWEKTIHKLRGRYMPPAGLPRPDDTAYESLISALETPLDKAAAAKLNPGRTDTFRRLNRTEYRNAIRDLLAVEVDVSALLPPDESSHGFDNITVGTLSPTLLERYLNAAQKIARLAVGLPSRSPGGDTLTLPPDLTQEHHFDGLPLGTRGGLSSRYTFPANAEYEFNIRLQRDRNEHVEGLREAHDIELLLDGERISTFTVKPPPPGNDHSVVDKDLNIRIPVKAGPRVVTATFPKRPSLLLEGERQPYQARFNMDRHPRVHPAVFSISVNGPYNAQGPGDTPSRRGIFVCRPESNSAEPDCAQRIFATLTRRAYRRATTANDTQSPMNFFRMARSRNSFDHGIEMGLRAILMSPEFLFRIEQDPPGLPPQTAYRITPVELASRLSFFLWSSIPDDELLNLATQGRLPQPEVLQQQVRRMLADPRSSALVHNFAEQWLHLRNLASTHPDMRLFPDFDDNLRQSFRKETELFFETIMREDRSILDLFRANFTFVNERLAKHYRIPNVYGSRFRRVDFETGERGGLLRHGSILTITSYATRTSPVIRGKWVLDNLLGMPPLPPPPSVPALKENTGTAKALPFRERIAQHRADPACAGCHQLMDPVGFAFENYDAIGRWRTHDESGAIDSSGSLPDGSNFASVEALQQALLKRPDVFATTFANKLLTYALGRGASHTDAPAVRKVVRDARKLDYRFSTFITGIVNSTPFQMRATP